MKRGANLKFPLKGKYVAMLAPSFVVDFPYPKIILQLKDLGFDKVVELTFGAKMINRDYHKILKKSKDLVIASVCPGIVETIRTKFPQYKKNLINVDSPMVAMARICKKEYPKHKIVFFSPCNFKKVEAEKTKIVDYVLDYKELNQLLKCKRLDKKKYSCDVLFDRFYNDYTKIYPLAGGLSKTAHLKKVLKSSETETIDGVKDVIKFLNNPRKGVKFLDVNFCKGGCIGGPCINSLLPISLRKKKVLQYLEESKQEDIPESRKGLIKKARGVSFKSDYSNK